MTTDHSALNAPVNPYAAPDSDLSNASEESGIEIFERFSAWGVFALMFVTGGIYYWFWLYNRTKSMNQVVENKISGALVKSTITVIIGYLVCYLLLAFSAGAGSGALSAIFGALFAILYIPAIVLPYVWVFKIRNRLNQITNSEKGDKTWAGPIMTFFFHGLYLQYKINQNLDEVKTN